jgi:hypothetical protein
MRREHSGIGTIAMSNAIARRAAAGEQKRSHRAPARNELELLRDSDDAHDVVDLRLGGHWQLAAVPTLDAAMKSRPEGELLFESYLAEHGYPEPSYEPDLGVPTRPDYVVTRGEDEAICEVEEFDPDSGWSPAATGSGARSRSLNEVLSPVRNKIRAGAKQLKPLADSGRALVIVLANPGGAWVGLSPPEMVWAMYGDPAFAFAVDPETGEAVDDGGFITTRNGKLRNDHPYVSAVAVVFQRERAVDFYDELLAGMDGANPDEKMRAIHDAKDRGEVPEGHYHRLDVYRTMSAHATPVPASLFSGPRDRLFEFDAGAGAYVWTGGPPPETPR